MTNELKELNELNRRILGEHLIELGKHLSGDDFEEYENVGLTDLELAFNDYIYGVMAVEYSFNK